jgi:hypothetical protein
VREAVLANGVFQRLHHVALSDDLLETLRAPFARDDLIGHFFLCPLRVLEGTSGTLRRTKLTRYRCSLPGLAGFAGNRRTKPEVPPIGERETRRNKFAKRVLSRNGESNTADWAAKVFGRGALRGKYERI